MEGDVDRHTGVCAGGHFSGIRTMGGNLLATFKGNVCEKAFVSLNESAGDEVGPRDAVGVVFFNIIHDKLQLVRSKVNIFSYYIINNILIPYRIEHIQTSISQFNFRIYVTIESITYIIKHRQIELFENEQISRKALHAKL